jgi:hypothetical protein
MSDADSSDPAQTDRMLENRSGGATLSAENDIGVGGDVVGRDKIGSVAGGIVVTIGRATAKAVVIEVRDTGAGIDPPDLLNVWERFCRSGENGGAGLWLSDREGVERCRGGDEYDLFNQPGKYVRLMDSHAVERPCPDCGTRVQKIQ